MVAKLIVALAALLAAGASSAQTWPTKPIKVIPGQPGGAWRMRELAEGVMCTIVNGQVLIEDGKPTGALPGRVVRNALYRERQEARAMGAAATA